MNDEFRELSNTELGQIGGCGVIAGDGSPEGVAGGVPAIGLDPANPYGGLAGDGIPKDSFMPKWQPAKP